MKFVGIITLLVVSLFIIPTPTFAAYLGSESIIVYSNSNTIINNAKYDSYGGSYTVCASGVDGPHLILEVREEDPSGSQYVYSAVAFTNNPCFNFSTANFVDGPNNKAELVFYFNTGIKEYINVQFYD